MSPLERRAGAKRRSGTRAAERSGAAPRPPPGTARATLLAVSAPPRPLRIVSYNVRYFGHALRGLASTRRPKRAIATALAALDPIADLICLQEVETISMRSRIAFRHAHADQPQLEAFMTELGEAFAAVGKPCPYKAFYFRAHSYGPLRLPIYTTGLAVLVHLGRLHVVGNNQSAPHRITHHHVVMMRQRKQTRICAHLHLEHGGRPLHVFNTHLSLPTPFAREFWAVKEKMGSGVNQLREAQSLIGYIRALAANEPFVVCGDFNSAPGSPVYRYLTGDAGLVCVEERLGLCNLRAPRGFPTAGIARLRMHLDHFFSHPRVSWLDMEGTAAFGDRSSPFHGLSDHVPLIGRCRIDAP
jgi:endonuclease/exonuclease/phosphatase family metal-dependent hydrolase